MQLVTMNYWVIMHNKHELCCAFFLIIGNHETTILFTLPVAQQKRSKNNSPAKHRAA